MGVVPIQLSIWSDIGPCDHIPTWQCDMTVDMFFMVGPFAGQAALSLLSAGTRPPHCFVVHLAALSPPRSPCRPATPREAASAPGAFRKTWGLALAHLPLRARLPFVVSSPSPIPFVSCHLL